MLKLTVQERVEAMFIGETVATKPAVLTLLLDCGDCAHVGVDGLLLLPDCEAQ